MALIKVVAIQDSDSHWYVIPVELKDLFRQMEEVAGQADDYYAFESQFAEYRTGGDLNLTQLYAEI